MNSQKLAEFICSYRKDRDAIKRGQHESYKICDGFSINLSDDCMVWYIWKRVPDQVRSFVKIVPDFWNYSAKDIERILDAQSWCCI